jgi:hypothetical protein
MAWCEGERAHMVFSNRDGRPSHEGDMAPESILGWTHSSQGSV